MENLYLALGSNVGNRYENILNAVKILNGSGVTIVRNSSLYETYPYGYINQSNFLNIVLNCKTELEPLPLLLKIKETEKRVGRTESFRWGPRVIDIDILIYGSLVLKTEELTIPHAELKERDFFLIPLLEIDGNITDPETNIPLRHFALNLNSHIIRSASVDSDFNKIRNNKC